MANGAAVIETEDEPDLEGTPTARATSSVAPGYDDRPEPFVAYMTRRIGGWRPRHGMPEAGSATALMVCLAAACVVWAILALRQLPCAETLTDAPNTFYRLCYSDIPVLYQTRELQAGANPYGLEYPVLTGVFVSVSRAITQLLGGVVAPNTSWPVTLHSLNIFTGVTSVMLFLCFLGVVACHVLMNHERRWDAMMIAAAPVVAAAGFINWDMLCLLFTALAILFWARRRPLLAGVFIGLGIAAKLYTGLLLIPLFALCLRGKRLREFAVTAGATALAWVVPNAIVYALYPSQWQYFWTFNAQRPPDLGSLWYLAKLMGASVPDNISLPVTLLDAVGAAAVIALCLLAPRRPRLGQAAYLMVMWFLVVNKVYSPQYVLWLLPFVVLARPRWRDYIIWTIAELGYFCAVWGHLAQAMTPPTSTDDRLYWLATIVRVAAELWLGAMVVLDILRPEEDIVRRHGVDDPIGGVLVDGLRGDWTHGGTGEPATPARAVARDSEDEPPAEPDGPADLIDTPAPTWPTRTGATLTKPSDPPATLSE